MTRTLPHAIVQSFHPVCFYQHISERDFEMKASETKLQPMLEGTKQYIVPLFQRSYDWNKKEWEVLWSDIIELCEMDNPRTHFIGSIVTMPATSVPEGVTKYLLIDGQQRLTTIFILLSLLRDIAKQTGQHRLAEEINNTILVNPYKEDPDYFKLQPTQVDRIPYQKIIKSESFDNQNNITNAYKFFAGKFKQSNLNIQTIKKVIVSNLSVVSIVLDMDDNPHLVFESLNAKGRPLTQSDLIRNYFMMKIHINEQEKIYSQYWKPMQDNLGESLTEFIRHYLMKGGEQVKQSEVYFFLKDKVNQGNALECLKDLEKFSTYYQKLLKPEYEGDINIRRGLNRINRIEVTTAYPFLLNCYDDYSQGRISADEFVNILNILENFMIRRFVCNIPTNQLNKIFPPLYSQVQSKNLGNFVDSMKNILQNKGYPKDAEFKARLLDAKLYGTGDRARKTQLILESIEESYDHKEQVSFDSLSIEHIMPQTLTEYWQNHLGDDWEMTHELLLHTIGNLTLTAYNPELSNDDFESKRNRLSNSHLEMNKYFKDKPSWKKKDIEERSQHLAEIVLSIWPYFGDETTAERDSSDVTGTTPKELFILGQRFIVQTWRDVLENTMNTIAELEPEKFEQIIQQFPRFVGRDKNKFRAARELKNGAFIEVNMSAKSIQSLCIQALEVIEITTDEWSVKYED